MRLPDDWRAAAACCFNVLAEVAAAGTEPSSLSSSAADLTSAGTVEGRYAAGETVYVTSSALNARSGPSSSSRIVSRLHRGQAANVVDSKGDWLKVAQGAALVWIAASHVSNIQPVRAQAPQSLVGSTARQPRSRSRSTPRRGNFIDGTCPCSGSRICIGPRGGRYCITSGGNKRYGV